MPEPRANAEPSPGVTLVLGGGGFKGMAHIGVLLELEAAGVRVERLVGTSAGALIAAAYIHAGSATALRKLVLEFVNSDDFQSKGFVGFGIRSSRTGPVAFVSRLLSGIKRQVALERMFRRSSAFGGAALRFVVRGLVPKVRIEDLDPPLAVAALDLRTGEEILLTEGHLASAVCASSSVPGFFPPVEREGRILVDSGIVNNLPTRAARSLGATRIVAVDLSSGLPSHDVSDVGMEILLRTQDISTRHANRRWSAFADVVLSPRLDGRNWLDATNLDLLIAAGAAAAREGLPDVLALIGRPSEARLPADGNATR